MRRSAYRRLILGRDGAGVYLSTLLVFYLSVLSPPASPGEDRPEVVEPKVLSVFPLVGRAGTTIQDEARGNLLAGAYAVWFDAGSLNGRVLKVEEVKDEVNEKAIVYRKGQKPPMVYRALIEVEIQPRTHLE